MLHIQFAVWISQLNVTYTPLENVTKNSACTFFSLFRAVFASLFVPSVTYQPGGTVYPTGDPIVNGSMFVALTDTDLFGAYFIFYLPMWGKP